MAKSPKGSNSTSTTCKAGKKAGSWVAPPSAKPENLDASLLGDKQFVARQWPAPLPAPEGSWEQAMDTLCRAFGVRRRKAQDNYDTGYRMDSHRKQVIVPPRKGE